MELRHLRYFIAVADAGSLTVAAEQILHTAQPSLSRQIRDLERQVGTALLTRGARGIELTPAGRVFLDQARIAVMQVEAACVAARRAAQPAKPHFALGFLTGQEMDWLPAAMDILRDELPKIEVTVSSRFSPDLADGLSNGTIDAAFLRREPNRSDLAFKRAVTEPLCVVLPSDHPLARQEAVRLRDLQGESFIGVSNTAPVLRTIIEDFLKRSKLRIAPTHQADNLSMAISLVASTRGFALLPIYAHNFLPVSVVGRSIQGEAPTIDLMIGFRKANTSPLLKLFLSRTDRLIDLVSGKKNRLEHP